MIEVPMTVTPQVTSVPVSVSESSVSLPGNIDVSYVVQPYAQYDGSYSVTPGKDSQTLATANKALTQNVTISGDNNLIAANILKGKSIFGVDGSADIASPFGANLEYVGHLYHENITLNDTSFPTWTPTSTSTTIRASSAITTFAADMANYDYVILTKATIDPAYSSAATNVSRLVRTVFSMAQLITKRPSSPANTEAEKYNTNVGLNTIYINSLLYYGSNGNYTVAYNTNNGIYFANSSPTFSSSTSNTPTVTVPSVPIKAGTSGHLSADNANAIDEANSIIKISYDLYRTKKNGTLFAQLIHDDVDLFNNGLTLPTN